MILCKATRTVCTMPTTLFKSGVLRYRSRPNRAIYLDRTADWAVPTHGSWHDATAGRQRVPRYLTFE